MTALDDIESLVSTATDVAVETIRATTTVDDAAQAAKKLTGRRSDLGRANEKIKELDPADRPLAGRLVSEAKRRVEALAADRRAELERNEAAGAPRDALDPTLGGHGRVRGHLHLVTQVQRELEDIFVGMGYRVMEGPEVEDDWHNFEALNMPPAHPARSMQDTLYVELGEPEQVMLRTHTSPVQIRTMEQMKPPIFVVAPGRTYRNETLDARHSPVFHQMEALAVDHGITLADLFGTIETFVRAVFDDETIRTRFRPDFFPYTEPSAELAVSCIFCGGEGCRVCSQTGWIELGGCGMVDPNVLAGVGIDPEEYTGFAFGFGLERIAMIRHGIDEIKTFFDDDVRFLAQF
jgi:phenylalanyl-tRNA synthetase alpha chain